MYVLDWDRGLENTEKERDGDHSLNKSPSGLRVPSGTAGPNWLQALEGD